MKKAILFIAIVGVVGWFIFKPDYTQPWLKVGQSGMAYVQSCMGGSCSQFYRVEIENAGKSNLGQYILTTEFDNGGEIEAEVTCFKDGSDHVCAGVGTGGKLWRFRK